MTSAMLDSGATGNFISWKYIQWKQLPTQKKKFQYEAHLANKSSTVKIGEETPLLPVTIQQHLEEVTFDVVNLAISNVILGLPW